MVDINLKKPLLDAQGKEQGAIVLSEMLSDLIMQSTITETPLKYFDWALELRKSGKLKLDSTDRDKLADFVEKHQTLFILPKGRLLQEIRK